MNPMAAITRMKSVRLTEAICEPAGRPGVDIDLSAPGGFRDLLAGIRLVVRNFG